MSANPTLNALQGIVRRGQAMNAQMAAGRQGAQQQFNMDWQNYAQNAPMQNQYTSALSNFAGSPGGVSPYTQQQQSMLTNGVPELPGGSNALQQRAGLNQAMMDLQANGAGVMMNVGGYGSNPTFAAVQNPNVLQDAQAQMQAGIGGRAYEGPYTSGNAQDGSLAYTSQANALAQAAAADPNNESLAFRANQAQAANQMAADRNRERIAAARAAQGGLSDRQIARMENTQQSLARGVQRGIISREQANARMSMLQDRVASQAQRMTLPGQSGRQSALAQNAGSGITLPTGLPDSATQQQAKSRLEAKLNPQTQYNLQDPAQKRDYNMANVAQALGFTAEAKPSEAKQKFTEALQKPAYIDALMKDDQSVQALMDGLAAYSTEMRMSSTDWANMPAGEKKFWNEIMVASKQSPEYMRSILLRLRRNQTQERISRQETATQSFAIGN